MKTLVFRGKIYIAIEEQRLYIPVVFTPVPGGVIMTQGKPLTRAQVVAASKRGVLPQHPNCRCVITPQRDDLTDLKGAALLKQWDEDGRDGQ